MIDLRDLVVVRGGRTICKLPGLAVAAGERVAIIGPNGAGKTTALRVMAGLEKDHRGVCRVDAGRGERVLVHQDPVVFRGTALDNVLYGLAARRVPDRRRLALAMMERLGIDHLASAAAHRLSAGERRRVVLARAFVLAPPLLLLDEPFDELDDDGTSRAHEVLAQLDRTTAVICSPRPLPGDAGAMRAVPLG